MEYFLHRLHHSMQQVIKSLDIFDRRQPATRKIFRLFQKISSIGYSATLGDYEKRKLAIFNQLNFFQLITGVLVPIAAILTSKNFPADASFISILPGFISL